MKKKYRVEALGCRTNQYEAQAFRDQLENLGYEKASDDEEAELVIVNTCTVTEGADSNSRHLIRNLVRKNPEGKVLVTGCLAERDPKGIASIQGVTDVISNKDKEVLLKKVFPDTDLPEFSITRFDAHTRAFVKVQDGCNSFCSYCILPYVRGRSRSRTVDDIVKEVETLVANGYKEVVITGINVGDFDGGVKRGETKVRLAELVHAVDQVEGLKRLRVSSIDPDEVDEELQEVLLNGKCTCKSIHLVLQSGSNQVLKRMNRKYTRQIFLETVRRIQAACPDFTFTTDVIVGFPGETEHDFEETLDVLKTVQFAKVHMFPFSVREGTKAEFFENKICADVMRQRRAKVLEVDENEAFLLRQKFVGRTMSLLTENIDDDDPEYISGHTDNFLRVSIPKEDYRPNELLDVVLLQNTPKGFIGEVVKKISNF